MADAHGLGPCGETRGGSNPLSGTKTRLCSKAENKEFPPEVKFIYSLCKTMADKVSKNIRKLHQKERYVPRSPI